MDFQELIQPLPESAIFQDPNYFIWCGSLTRDDEGLFHLLYSRWPREHGFLAWVTHSEIAHATAESPFGPFVHRDVALPERGPTYWDGHCTHNPTVIRTGGKYYLYYTGNFGDRLASSDLNWSHRNHQRVGVAVANSPYGPWTRFDQPLINPEPGFHDALCCNNPSVTTRPEGGFLMVYKAVGDRAPLPFGGPVTHVAAISQSPLGPFQKHPSPVFTKPGEHFPAEDPFIWAREGGYYAIVKDMDGVFTGRGRSLALFESRDGLDWKLSRHALVSKTEIRWENRTRQVLHALERPQLWLEDGVPRVLLCAAEFDAATSGSFNVQIPLK